jgi:hypothetical protein
MAATVVWNASSDPKKAASSGRRLLLLFASVQLFGGWRLRALSWEGAFKAIDTPSVRVAGVWVPNTMVVREQLLRHHLGLIMDGREGPGDEWAAEGWQDIVRWSLEDYDAAEAAIAREAKAGAKVVMFPELCLVTFGGAGVDDDRVSEASTRGGRAERATKGGRAKRAQKEGERSDHKKRASEASTKEGRGERPQKEGERSEHKGGRAKRARKKGKRIELIAPPQPVSRHPVRPSRCASSPAAGGVRGVSPRQPQVLPASTAEELRQQRQQQRHLVIFTLALPPARDSARSCHRRAASVVGAS